jgi:hypothetical protein
MADAIALHDAVRLARETMGAAPAPEMAHWISTHLGLTVKPAIVKVMLGLLQERELLEQGRLKAMELARQSAAEGPAEKPKKRQAGNNPVDGPASSSAIQSPKGPRAEEASKRANGVRGCPECTSGDYVFRGRKKDKPKEGEAGPVIETKFHCRGCGHQWKERQPG